MTLEELTKLLAQQRSLAYSGVSPDRNISYDEIIQAIQSQYQPQASQIMYLPDGANRFIDQRSYIPAQLIEYGMQMQQQSPSFVPSDFDIEKYRYVEPVANVVDTVSGSGGDGGYSDSYGVATNTDGSTAGGGQGISNSAIDAALGAIAFGNSAVGKGLSMALGVPVSTIAKGIGTAIADQQIDAISNSFGALGTDTLGGQTATVSDQSGNISTVSNQGITDAFDMANFGVTSGGLDGYGTDGGVSGIGVGSADGVNGMDAASDAASSDGGDGGGGGGGKIVCTAMNNAYGFGSFRNQIWLKYSADRLTKAHEVGYHTLFLPLVDLGYTKDVKVVRKVLEHIARHRTADLRAEMRGTKRDSLGRVYRFVLEPLCYVVGKLKGY